MEGPGGTGPRSRLRSARPRARRGPSPSPPGARGRREDRHVGNGRGAAGESAAEAVATGAGAGVAAGDNGEALRFRPARQGTDGPTSPRRSRVFLPAPLGPGRRSGLPASPGARARDRRSTGARRSCTSRSFGPRNRCSRCGKPSCPAPRSTISSNRNWLACCLARRTPGRRTPRLVRRRAARGGKGGKGGSESRRGHAPRAGARPHSPSHGLRRERRRSPVRFRPAPLNVGVWDAEFGPPIPAPAPVLAQPGFDGRIAQAASRHSPSRG